MTMILNTATPSAAAPSAQPTGAVAAAKDTSTTAAPSAGTTASAASSAASAGAAGTTASTASSASAPAQPAPAQAFAQWLGQQLDGHAAAPQAANPATSPVATDAVAASTTAAKPAVTATTAGAGDDDSKTGSAAPDGALLAAMAMPLMPLTQQQITVALQAAAGNAPARSDDKTQAAAASAATGAVAGMSAASAASADNATRAAALALPQLAALQQPVQVQAQPATAASAQTATPGDAAATRLAVQAAASGASGSAGNSGSGDARDGGADQNAALGAATPLAGSAAVVAAAPAADTVKLAGPPTAWRQTLQEALGQRLNVQNGANMQQATITLEPPQLGRIDIAIRHSAGTLEVNITATNGEVLRQLQTVSDNLRSDLSQRQYTDVAVTVAPAPKSSATPFGDPQQQQGRGRQPGRDQDAEPGRGLAEASTTSSGFSLGGRES
jgi:flagellar hook-length control protein FliK